MERRMSRVGSDPNKSSDRFEARMMPDVEPPKPDGGGYVDCRGDGQHNVYLSPWQNKVRNFGARNTKVRGGRGTGKSSFLGVSMMDVTLGLPRMMGGFCGANAKQLYTRTIPNVLKVVNLLGFENFYFLGQPPARLRWPSPLARPRVWENCISFANGFVWQALSLAIRGSANGLNLAAIFGDETKYMPWGRVKEEVLPTLRGDFMPPSARKTEVKRWGYGTDPKMNNHWLSQLFVSDAGLNARECEWEKEKDYETVDVNKQISEMLAELHYLELHHPKQAQELAKNDVYLSKLFALRAKSEAFFNLSSIENISMLGGEAYIRQMKRELPDLLFRLQILGQEKGSAKDGFYCNYSELNNYTSAEITDLVFDKYSMRKKGKALDAQQWPTEYETETLDLDQLQHDGENCSLDLDLDYQEPLRIALDANSDINCFVVGQTRVFKGRPSLLVMKEFFVQGEIRLRGLCKKFSNYYRPFLRHGCKDVIFYVGSSIKQGNQWAYAVENGEDSRFDKVVERELIDAGFNVIRAEFTSWRQERKYQAINDAFSFTETPAVYINSEAGRTEYLRASLENAAIIPGTFKKDKHEEKYKSNTGVAGDKRERTTISDAFDDLFIGVKIGAEGHHKVGGGLNGRFKNLLIPV